jgi:hypothetical protein
MNKFIFVQYVYQNRTSATSFKGVLIFKVVIKSPVCSLVYSLRRNQGQAFSRIREARLNRLDYNDRSGRNEMYFMRRIIILLAISFLLPCLAAGNDTKIYRTAEIRGDAPVIDGRFDDHAWEQVEWQSGFIQREPQDGAEPTQQTAFKILYDQDNIYVAIRAFEDDPSKIVRRLTRRDQIDGDIVGVQIDSYADKRTAFSFFVSAAGVKVDFFVSNNGQSEDFSWDPIWYVRTSVDESGWNAEMQIPLSQLRFSRNGNGNWGLQVARYIHRYDELSLWKQIPKESSGWVHQFGELAGIFEIKPRRQMDLSPYTVARTESFERVTGNPYADGSAHGLNGGLDAKFGITNDLTLDVTVNPDFGQVEADPSVVNLTAFETFFEEKRPFFIEGRNIFRFNLTPGDGEMAADNLFYSRRIGRNPQYRPSTGPDEYVSMPGSTPILGALKLSGKTREGLSIGAMQTMTARQYARISHEGAERHQAVEPLTSYSVARVQQDLNDGNTIVGLMLTSTVRDLDGPALQFLHNAAYSGGIDFTRYWNDRNWYFSSKMIFSHVRGGPEALYRTQTSPVRYYQRPDASHVRLDPDRTTLSGHGGTLEIGRIGGGNFSYGGFLHWKSPGLDLNDIGFVRNTDETLQVLWAGYRILEPVSLFRTLYLNVNQYTGFDFGGNLIANGGNFNINTQLTNYWSAGAGSSIQLERKSNYVLRGGPSMLIPGFSNSWIGISSDGRKKLRFSARFINTGNFEGSGHQNSFRLTTTWLPVNALSLTISPSFTVNTQELQYVTQMETGKGKRYILAGMDQKTAAMAVRLNYSITPELSLQYYGQPFVSTARYRDFKYVTNPGAASLADRYSLLSGSRVMYDEAGGRYFIDEDNDGGYDYSIGNPDFNALFFNSNLVLRWEYMPGSVMFLVWSQGRSQYSANGEFSFGGQMGELFDIHPHNIFLIKISYRLGK